MSQRHRRGLPSTRTSALRKTAGAVLGHNIGGGLPSLHRPLFFPFPFPPPTLPSLFPSPSSFSVPVEVGPLNTARWSGGAP